MNMAPRQHIVAFIDRRAADEIVAIRHWQHLPERGKVIVLDELGGKWEVCVVQPLPGSPEFDFIVYLDRR